jgi:hypothetical protein
MPMIRQGSGGMKHGLWLVVAALAGCGGGGDGNQAAFNAAAASTGPEGELPVLSEQEQAALADEAAADEAADMDAFGGNAAAGETGNAFLGHGGAAVPGEGNGAR